MLTAKESAAFEALKKVSENTLWGAAVHNFLKTSPTPEAFRILVKDLKSQCKDSPEAMKKILGKAYNKIIKL